MDNVKKAVAERVQRVVLETNWNLIGVPLVENHSNSASLVPGSPLETSVKIYTSAGPRYFIVKVKEQY